ncbi:hypothetical protein [Gramella sp. AN32]|uniref:Alpha/beta hydrolase n=1 Tax=Christiangramia antarctica TaxID=2058158 RepID=A0ABW5X7P0_9FLAO|nr:hypothetical protein [Gramella sp. AN32]MCM4158050.1 hypothetical protein [Gramella sp. AN32]
MKNFLLSIFVISSFLANAQDFRFIKGSVTDSLPINLEKSATFALFAPSNYTSEKEWPVLFVFDPLGRGKSSANLFRNVAENQGYLIISSNINIKEKPLDSVVNMATTMFNTVFKSLPVNKQMVYSAGLSEGAQIASSLPIFYPDVSGVLAIGNSLLDRKSINKKKPFMFIAMGGKRDYMIYEMELYLKFFDDIDFPTDVYYYDGKEDEWPDPQILENAVSSFSLQAVKDGHRTKDENFVAILYKSQVDYAERLRRQLNYYDSYEVLERIEKRFEDFGYEDQTEDMLKELKRSDGFKKQRNNFRQITSYERTQQDEYEYLLKNDIYNADFQNIGWWAYQIDEIDKIIDNSDALKSNMASRLKGYLDFITKKNFDQIIASNAGIDYKIYISVLRTAINKSDPEAYLKIISLAGADGDDQTALLYLEDLLKTGFSDIEALYNIPGALNLTFTKEYNALIKQYLGESKYFND